MKAYKPTGDQPFKWLVMVYLSGDNNLSPEMIWALQEMAEVKLPEDVAITIQYDPRSPSFPPTRYLLTSKGPAQQKEFEAERDHLSSRLEEDVYEIPIAWAKDHDWDPRPTDEATDHRRSLNENAASPRVLANFIKWSIEKTHQPERRILVLSGHGSGAIGEFLPDENGRGGRPSALSIPQLREAFEIAASHPLSKQNSGGKFIDILGMDSCLMSMVEVGLEVQDYVHYLIGSEGFELTTGWPYGFMLTNWVNRLSRPTPGGRGLDAGAQQDDVRATAEHLVVSYRAFYRDHGPSGISADIAACDLTKLPTLVSNLKELVSHLVSGEAKPLEADDLWDSVVIAHWRAQSFKFEQYTDLWDFCHALQQKTDKTPKFSDVAKACEAVKKCIEDDIVVKQKTVGVEYQHAHGLSVFFPWSASLARDAGKSPKVTLPEYRALRFARQSDWARFLEYYLVATMRPERTVEKPRGKAAAGIEFKQIEDVTDGSPVVRFSPELNRFSPELNRNLVLMYGSTPPWSMKNPSQRIEVPVQCDTARHRSRPLGDEKTA